METVALAKPFTLYCDAFCTVDFGEAPSWASIEVDQGFIDRLLWMRSVCKDHGLSQCNRHSFWQQWGDGELNIDFSELVVTSSHFWFRGVPRHCDYAVKTRSIAIERFLLLIKDGEAANEDSFGWAGGVLFRDESYAADLARQLLEDGVIAVNADSIEQMAGSR